MQVCCCLVMTSPRLVGEGGAGGEEPVCKCDANLSDGEEVHATDGKRTTRPRGAAAHTSHVTNLTGGRKPPEGKRRPSGGAQLIDR